VSSDDLAGSVRATLDSLAEPGGPALVVGVYRDGALELAEAAGCAVVEHAVPATRHTVFDIASVSKQMTAACLLMLVRDGAVTLDADVRDLLPELCLRERVTLRHCLTHTGGLRDCYSMCELAGVDLRGIKEDRLVRIISRYSNLDFPPGTGFSYANTGYVLVAAAVRRITGGGLAAYAGRHLFGPLGMAVTHMRDDVAALVPHLAAGYVATARGFDRCDVTEEVVGDGAVVTSVADYAGWHRFMMTGAVLGTDIRDALLERATLADGTRIGYALGLEVAVLPDGTPAWWHSGSWAGYRSAVVHAPAAGLSVLVLANRNDRAPSQLALAVALAARTGRAVADCLEEARGHPVPAADGRAARTALVGRWHEPDQDLFLDITAAGGGTAAGGDDGGIDVHEDGEASRYRLGRDGHWHGVGEVAGATYRLDGSVLVAADRVSGDVSGRYTRAAAGNAGPLPAGRYTSAELDADALLVGSAPPRVTIGTAEPVTLAPAGPGAWYGGGVTVRADGAGLAVSTAGARRVRFAPGPLA
jgi:CubicO group peptidase (beta-lactamase class C family)